MWNYNGQRYTRKEFYALLVGKGQTKPLSKCRVNFRKDYADATPDKPQYPIYTTPSGNLFAVDLTN